METNTLAKLSPSCPLVSPLSDRPVEDREHDIGSQRVSDMGLEASDDRALALRLYCGFPRNLPLNSSQARAAAQVPEPCLL